MTNDNKDLLWKTCLGVILLILFIIAMRQDKQNNSHWDLCQQKFEDSGAPMEARDSMMRDCFSK